MENPLHHLEKGGEVASMEQARAALAEIARELDTELTRQASGTQVAVLRRILAN